MDTPSRSTASVASMDFGFGSPFGSSDRHTISASESTWETPTRKIVAQRLLNGRTSLGSSNGDSSLWNNSSVTTPLHPSNKHTSSNTLHTDAEVQTAQGRVDAARENIRTTHIEMQAIKTHILECMEQLTDVVSQYDDKAKQVISSESDLARWRAILINNGYSTPASPANHSTFNFASAGVDSRLKSLSDAMHLAQNALCGIQAGDADASKREREMILVDDEDDFYDDSISFT